MPDPITQVTFQNAGVLTLEGGFTTFGQTFQAGALMPGQQLLAEIGGQLVPVQVDVRNTYPDGSVKMAVLTMERPPLSPWQEATATLVAGDTAAPSAAVSLPQALAGHSASLTLAIEGRAPLDIDIGAAVTQAIANGTASFWQQGPCATQARVEIPVENSSMRVVLDVTGYADGEIRFTVGLNNDRVMEAVGGRLNYTATVQLDGVTLFEQTLSHAQYQRVNLDFASSETNGIQGLGTPQEGWLNIKHDIEYLKSTGAIFQFDTDFVADPGSLRHYYEQVANNPQWGEIFWNHEVAQSMGNVGGRPDIGYTTAPNAYWIISQDAAAAEYALGQAKVAGYVPWNFYDLANGTVLTTENYPRLWTDGRGGTGRPGDSASSGLTQQISTDTGWAANRSHQPDLSFVPYLLTGERWIYDNVMTQASHSLMDVWPAVRGDGEGIVIRDAQLRSAAWSMRQLEHAAWIAEDGSTEAAFFTKTIADNWNWVLANVDAWTTSYGEIAGFIPSAAYRDHIPVWQTNMFAGVVALSALRGSEEALQVLDFMSNFLLGALNSAEKGFDPHNAAAITIPTAVNGTPLTRWSDVADAMRVAGTYADGAFTYTEQEYHRMLVGGLTMAYAATGDERYRDAVETFLELAPPGARTDNYVRAPQFAVTLRDLHDLYMKDPLYPTTANKPVVLEVGSGPDQIVLKISQDYFNGNAQYVIFVDGTQVGGVFTASALKSLAVADTVTIRGDFGDTVTVRVQMTNDAYLGANARDRNLYVNAISHNGEDLPTRAYLANNTPQDFVFKADGTMISPPAFVRPEPNVIPVPEPQPEPAPEPTPPPSSDPPPSSPPPPVVVVPEPPAPPPVETIVFALSPRNPHSQGVLSVEANGDRVFEGALAAGNPASPWTVALDVASGESTEFVLSYARSGVSSLPLPGPALVGVAHDGIALPTLSHNFPASGVFRFTLHNGRPEDGVMAGTAGTDVFMLTGADARVTTGAGRDLLVVRDQGHYRVADFDPAQDRLMFEGMAAASLEATQQGQDMVIRFTGGSVVLEKTGLLALDAILLNAEPLLA